MTTDDIVNTCAVCKARIVAGWCQCPDGIPSAAERERRKLAQRVWDGERRTTPRQRIPPTPWDGTLRRAHDQDADGLPPTRHLSTAIDILGGKHIVKRLTHRGAVQLDLHIDKQAGHFLLTSNGRTLAAGLLTEQDPKLLLQQRAQALRGLGKTVETHVYED